MKEILPGIFHWQVIWPEAYSLESYWLKTGRGSVLIDPVECSGLGAIEEATDVAAILITTGYHERGASLFARRTQAKVFVPARDVEMLEDLDDYETYGHERRLPCGLRAVGVPGLTPGEQAIFSTLHGGTLFVGDALGTTAKWAPNGMPLGGHPGGHPAPSMTLAHLLELDFENLLPGHGPAIVGGARRRLTELIDSGASTSISPPRVSWFPRRLQPEQEKAVN